MPAWVALGLLLLAPLSARAALTSNAELALDRGVRHLYSLDYTQARADFRKLIELEPDNPFGYLFESGAIWWQSAQEYGLFKDTPTLQGLFEQDVEAAIRKAEPLTRSKDKAQKADGHFVEGMALGTRGQWALMRGHYINAYLDGKRAIKHLKKVSRIDGGYRDVDLGMGVYEYQAAHLSGVAKFSAFIGVRGDEKRGLKLLHSAMDHGRYGSRQAAEFLAIIYLGDKRDWNAALPILQKLRQDIPESVYFDSLELLAQWKLGHNEESFRIARAMFEKTRQDPRGFNRKLLSLACGLTTDHCLDEDQAFESSVWLTAAIDATPEPKRARNAKAAAPPDGVWPYLSTLHLYRAYMKAALGKADEASADFQWVLQHPDYADGHARAQECQTNGCPSKDLLVYLRSMAREEFIPAP